MALESILIALIVTALVAGLLIYAIDLLPVDSRLAQLLKVVVILLAVLLIVRHVGWI